jgi:hypothetical protein
MSIANTVKDLYQEKTDKVLYHYTSLNSITGIISSKSLWATDIRYFNDAAEMQHTAHLLTNEIDKRLSEETCHTKMLTQFRNWLLNRITNGHMLFVVSFTVNGNLLSQWRSYCPVAKGVSIGFLPENLYKCSSTQKFQLAKCIYDIKQQQKLAEHIVDEVEKISIAKGENSKNNPLDSFYDVFEKVESDILRIAALIKHPAFSEEEEWRAVSDVVTNYVTSPIMYREGLSSLIPYLTFNLPPAANRNIDIEHIYLGPTPNVNNSMSSLNNYLAKNGASPRHGTRYSSIPYRVW